MISLQKIIKAMETQPKTLEKRGKIEDLLEEEQFLRKKIMQKSTRPAY